jgi:hypothetical protein
VIGPVAAVTVDPLVDGDESVRAQRVDPALRVGPYFDEADFAQHPQVT